MTVINNLIRYISSSAIVDRVNFDCGIAGFEGSQIFVKDSLVIRKEFIPDLFKMLESVSQTRWSVRDEVYELKGPLRFWTGPGSTEQLLGILLGTIEALICGAIFYRVLKKVREDAIHDEPGANSSGNYWRIIGFVVSGLFGAVIFYLTQHYYRPQITLFCPSATFNWGWFGVCIDLQ